jgi:hypothetical protein
VARHLLIAGTGRAGTSFLVRYLTALGLDTHLARTGNQATWDEHAQAGLEDLPLSGLDDLPYVIKSPWSYQVLHDVLANGSLQFDAVVMPMRDLTEAAASRSIVEMHALHRAYPWMSELGETWEHYGHTPGGVVYSLNPVDQSRLLAVGFYQLLEHLVRAEVPTIFLSFPRLIEDADYLYRKLAAILPETITPEAARVAHAAIAEPSKVRVGTELQPTADASGGFVLHGPKTLVLERAALSRTLADVRRELEDVRARLTEAITVAQDAHAVRAREAEHLDAAHQVLAAMSADRDAREGMRQAAEQALYAAIRDRDDLQVRLAALEHTVRTSRLLRTDSMIRRMFQRIQAAVTRRASSASG